MTTTSAQREAYAAAITALPYQTIGTVSGLPLNWRDEQSGVLPAAVRHYINGGDDPNLLTLVHAYCGYYCAAPCWGDSGGDLIMAWAAAPISREGIWQIILACLEVGCDPL